MTKKTKKTHFKKQFIFKNNIRIFIGECICAFSILLFSCSKDDEVTNDNIDDSNKETPLPSMADPDDVCSSMNDPIFMRYCYEHFDINQDKKVSPHEASLVKQLDGIDLNVSDLTGIQYFSNLEALLLTNGNFTSLDLSHCKNLISLVVKAPLKHLNLDQNTKLRTLEIERARLTSIDISPLKSLISFVCNMCVDMKEVKLLYSQLDRLTIDNGIDINFIISDDPNRKLAKTAKVTYTYKISDTEQLINSSITINSDNGKYESGNITNTTYVETINFNNLPAHSEYSLSASFSGRKPTIPSTAFYIYLYYGFNLTIDVDIYIDNKLKISSSNYNCYNNSFQDIYSITRDNFAEVQTNINNNIESMLSSLKYKTIEIDSEGNVNAK